MNVFGLSLEELQSYQPKQTKKKDFNEFWEQRIEESKGQSLRISHESRSYCLPGVEVYDVYFEGFRNSRIHSTYIKPTETNSNAPTAVIFEGYNWGMLQPHHAFHYTIQGIPVLLVETRGQTTKSPDHNVYQNGGPSGWATLGIKNPDTYYYSYVYMDCYRSIEVARELSNTKAIFLGGSSQGGALALASAALHKDILLALIDVPFLSDFKRSIELASQGPYSEIQHYFKVHDPLHKTQALIYNTLSYVDCINLASLVTCPTLIGIGLKDEVCPPSSGFALYHQLKGEKKIQVYPEFSHELPPIHEEEKLKFLNSKRSW